MVRGKIRTMNVFALDRDPYISASYHCDKHVVKMIVEYAQLLSTAHRVLDGTLKEFHVEFRNAGPNMRSGKRVLKFLALPEERVSVKSTHSHRGLFEIVDHELVIENAQCYRASHANHPSAVWCRQSDTNYHWLVQLFEGCLREYEKRYGKIHACKKLLPFFSTVPKNIPRDVMTPFALAMPDQYKVDDEILSYQNYYVGDKVRFAKWTNTEAPKWFTRRVGLDASHFQRTR